MPTYRTKAQVRPDEPLVLSLPRVVPAGEVEIIVLYPEAETQPGTFASLEAFDAWLRTQPAVGRSKDAIDQAIAAERAAWE